MKYTVKISLSTIGINPLNGEYSIVSLDSEKLVLPTVELSENLTIQQILDGLATKHIDLNTNWIQYSLIESISLDSESILLLYRCKIPLDTLLKEAEWLPMWKCTQNPLTLTIINAL